MTALQLLEREAELATINEAIQAGTGRAGGLIAVEGPAGIGKTGLLGAARSAADLAGLRVLAARGSSLERSFAYGVVRQLFEPVLARSQTSEKEEILAGPAALAVPLFDVHTIEKTRRPTMESGLSLLHGLFWLAANLAERQPILLAIDDLHWCDTPSLDWLGYLLRRLEGVPIVIMVTLRAREPGIDQMLVEELTSDPLSTLLRPSPLSVAGSAHLVEELLGSRPDAEFSASCFEASGGNPLLLQELIKGLADEGVAPVASAAPRVGEVGPGAVSRSVRRRLARLPGEAQAFARALAVLGDGTDIDLVATLAKIDSETAADAAETLDLIDVVRRAPALTFVHALVRDAVYLEMPSAQRAEAHRLAATMLSDRRAPPEQAAAHVLLTPRAGNREAVLILREAAREALARSAPAIAAVYLGRALDEPPTPEERGELLFELGSAEALVRDPEAEMHLLDALTLCTDPPTRAGIELELARLLFWRNAPDEAVALLERGTADMAGPHRDLRARLEAELAGIALSSPLTHAAVAERLTRTPDATDQSVGAKMLLAFSAFRDTLRGESRALCIARAKEALEGGELLAEEASTAFLAVVQTLIYADELDLALLVSREARSLAEARGAPASFATASAAMVRVLHDMGRLLEAEAIGAAGLAACPRNQPVAKAYAVTTLAHVLLKRGDLAAAESTLAEADLDSAHVPRSLLAANPLMVHGLVHLAQGDAHAALGDFLAIRDLLEPSACRNPAVARWRSGAALAFLQLGTREEALYLAQTELELSRSWGAPAMLGRSLRTLGLVEGGRRGLELLEEGVVVLGRSPAAYELLQVQVELGASLRRDNQRGRARELLRDCLDRADRSGAGLLARQAREELLATGARPRRLVLSGVESLTASERRTATMAAEGMTNREIAQSLFVTTKTVEMHLAHVFGKLEIRSRTELPEALGSGAGRTPDSTSPTVTR